ncbi:MAG: hypothetical protein ABIH23_08480 [bacterium]
MKKKYKYQIAVTNVRDKFEAWIEERGGVSVWKNIDPSNPGAGENFTPALTAEGKPFPNPSRTTEFAETIKDISQFRFAKELKEVTRIKVAIRRDSNGFVLKLTDASVKKLHKALKKFGEDSQYQFDYDRQEAIIETVVWEE